MAARLTSNTVAEERALARVSKDAGPCVAASTIAVRRNGVASLARSRSKNGVASLAFGASPFETALRASSGGGLRCEFAAQPRLRRASSPLVHSGAGLAGLETQLLSSSPLRGVRNDRAFHRARGATCGEARGSRVPKANGKQIASDAGNACVPHATVLSACYSQRPHVLGALTECLHRHIAGSLGRPPRLRVLVLSLLCSCAPHDAPLHERPTDATGPSHPAPAPVTIPAHLFGRSGTTNKYS